MIWMPRTLELLEELLVEYAGTLLLVSHDRAFLDNVATNVLVFEGAGRIAEYTGGYQDWLRLRSIAPAPVLDKSTPSKPAPVPGKKQKFLNREQRELDELPGLIDQWETEKADLNARLWKPDLYKKTPELIPQLKQELASLEKKIETSYTRWQELEQKRAQSA